MRVLFLKQVTHCCPHLLSFVSFFVLPALMALRAIELENENTTIRHLHPPKSEAPAKQGSQRTAVTFMCRHFYSDFDELRPSCRIFFQSDCLETIKGGKKPKKKGFCDQMSREPFSKFTYFCLPFGMKNMFF